jgi:hypothetical protein
MEEQMDTLRSCLLLRLSLRQEQDILSLKQHEIINPRMYVDCMARLDEIQCKLYRLSWEIQKLTSELRAKLSSHEKNATEGAGDETISSTAEQDASCGTNQPISTAKQDASCGTNQPISTAEQDASCGTVPDTIEMSKNTQDPT